MPSLPSYLHASSPQASKKAATLKNTDTYQSMISDVSYSYWHESPMVEAYAIIRNLDETKLGEFCKSIPGVTAISFIYKLDSMLRDMLRRRVRRQFHGIQAL